MCFYLDILTNFLKVFSYKLSSHIGLLVRAPPPRDGVNRELAFFLVVNREFAIFLVVNRELGYGRDRELSFFLWS